jgi:hypothetical protein
MRRKGQAVAAGAVPHCHRSAGVGTLWVTQIDSTDFRAGAAVPDTALATIPAL